MRKIVQVKIILLKALKMKLTLNSPGALRRLISTHIVAILHICKPGRSTLISVDKLRFELHWLRIMEGKCVVKKPHETMLKPKL